MKKKIVIASFALLTTAGVTAAMLSTGEKKPTKSEAKKKECTKTKKSCSFWN